MQKTKKSYVGLEWDEKSSANAFQVDGGVSGVVVEVNGAIVSSPADDTYWIQFWDGDPSGGGEFITSLPVDHKSGTPTALSSGQFTDIGIYCYEIWIRVSTDPFQANGSVDGHISVGYQPANNG